jgi:hypothetical protein
MLLFPLNVNSRRLGELTTKVWEEENSEVWPAHEWQIRRSLKGSIIGLPVEWLAGGHLYCGGAVKEKPYPSPPHESKD